MKAIKNLRRSYNGGDQEKSVDELFCGGSYFRSFILFPSFLCQWCAWGWFPTPMHHLDRLLGLIIQGYKVEMKTQMTNPTAEKVNFPCHPKNWLGIDFHLIIVWPLGNKKHINTNPG